MNVLFSIFLRDEDKKNLIFSCNRYLHAFSNLSQNHIGSLTLCHNIVKRNLRCLMRSTLIESGELLLCCLVKDHTVALIEPCEKEEGPWEELEFHFLGMSQHQLGICLFSWQGWCPFLGNFNFKTLWYWSQRMKMDEVRGWGWDIDFRRTSSDRYFESEGKK